MAKKSMPAAIKKMLASSKAHTPSGRIPPQLKAHLFKKKGAK